MIADESQREKFAANSRFRSHTTPRIDRVRILAAAPGLRGESGYLKSHVLKAFLLQRALFRSSASVAGSCHVRVSDQPSHTLAMAGAVSGM